MSLITLNQAFLFFVLALELLDSNHLLFPIQFQNNPKALMKTTFTLSTSKKLAISIAALTLTTNMAANATALTEVEANDTVATAQSIAHDGTIVLTGFRESSPTNGFNDFFRFGATVGDQITFTVNATTSGDPVIRLLDGTGGLLVQNDDSGGSLNSLITYSILVTGDYFAAVRGFANSVYEYQLNITGLTPSENANVPVPGSLALLGLGMLGLALNRKTKA
jgi:Bacterial pre-peptidase C-terminal domain/PEP-CTERM motif